MADGRQDLALVFSGGGARAAYQVGFLRALARLFPELELSFRHAITHEVTYGSLLAERRRELHGRESGSHGFELGVRPLGHRVSAPVGAGDREVQPHQPVGLGVREAGEERRAQRREDRRVAADAEREREDDDGGEAGRSAERSERVTEVLE